MGSLAIIAGIVNVAIFFTPRSCGRVVPPRRNTQTCGGSQHSGWCRGWLAHIHHVPKLFLCFLDAHLLTKYLRILYLSRMSMSRHLLPKAPEPVRRIIELTKYPMLLGLLALQAAAEFTQFRMLLKGAF